MESANNKIMLIVSFAAASLYALEEVERRKRKRKRVRRVWVRPWVERRDTDGFCVKLLNELRLESPLLYKNFLQMSALDFDHLLALVGPSIAKKDTPMRLAIPASTRLILTLRFLATGDSFRSLQYIFRIPHNTISNIVPEVCDAIYHQLKDGYMKFPSTENDWLKIAEDYMSLWNFPNCIGAIDGKHIVMNAPAHSGSIFYNYKGTHSIVLLGLVDARYRFTYIDVGCNGSAADGGVFQSTSLCDGLANDSFQLPQDSPLPQREVPVPYIMVGNDVFATNNRLLKPFSHKPLSDVERVFNNRLSRARRVIENSFGILSARFRVLRRPIALNASKIRSLTATCCALHNFLISKNSNYFSPNLVDREAHDGSVIPGEWRLNNEESSFHDLPSNPEYIADDDMEIRIQFAEYLFNEGELQY